MEKNKVKEEFIKRYKYIYENSILILLPYIYVESVNGKANINFKKIDELLLLNLELFLLSDIEMENSDLYKMIESKKNNIEELEEAKNLIKNIDNLEINIIDNKHYDLGNIKLDDWDILLLVWSFIKKQDAKNKVIQKEIDVLDSYFEMARYTNDGNIWKGGRYRSPYDNYNGLHPKEKDTRIIDNSIPDNIKMKSMKPGVFVNKIFEYKCNDLKFIDEGDKERIYFSLHDELPWNLEIDCCDNESILNSNEYELPKCIKKIRVREDDIFINPDNEIDRYLLICPHCGKIVNVNDNLLSDEVKLRIEKRCQSDPYLFKKMCLNSELQLLKNISKKFDKSLIKKQ